MGRPPENRESRDAGMECATARCCPHGGAKPTADAEAYDRTRVRRTPGPLAAQAFDYGLLAVTAGYVVLVSALFWTGAMTGVGFVVALVCGSPVLVIVVSCLLGAWLGYRKDAADVVAEGRSQEARD